jgi:class 3 adenylate cyclase
MPTPAQFDVAAWLTQLGLAGYIGAFRDNDIDATVLPTLTADDLRELGVASVGHRRRILEAVARLSDAAEMETVAEVPATVEEPHSAERRMLTVMFCDLMESVALSVQIDPEDYREFIASFRHAVETVIHSFGGTVAQYAGDGLMAHFGYPHSSDHDAENAVAAGLAVVDAVKRMAPLAGRPPRVRVAVATGLLVVGALDNSHEFLGGAVGEAPNLAARLQGIAAANTVVVAEATRELIGGMFNCLDLGEFDLKGFDRPVRAWRVDGRASATSRFDALRGGGAGSGFVGRETELARLRDSLGAARAGRGQFVIITGQPGFGKSRLARQMLEEANQTTAGSLILQCSPSNVGSPLHPLRSYIERAGGIGAGEPAQQALRKLSVYLANAGPVAPERLALLADLLGIEGADGTALGGLSPHERRARTMRHLASIVEAAARASPVFVIEDAQWIDPSTAELVESLVPVLRGLPVLLIATARPGPFPFWLAHAEAELVRLNPLTVADARRLVRSIVGEDGVAAEAVEAIAVRSDGVPIFAEELARAYLDAIRRHESFTDPSQIPATLAETILGRLDRLVHGRRVAPIAAAIGRGLPTAVLLAVSRLTEPVAQAGIRELLDADIMMPDHSPFGEAVSFKHLLVRDAAYSLLLRRDRTNLHARIAGTLEKAFPAIAEALPHVMAFQHTQSGQFAAAARDWDRAGRMAAKRSAYSEAMSHLSKAIESIRQLPAGPERDEAELGYRIEFMGALIAARGFSAEGVRSEMERIVALSRDLGSSAKLIPALQSRWVVLLTSGAIHAARELALQMREAATLGSEIDRLVAHRTCGTSLLFSADFKAALGEYHRFLELYDPERHAADLRLGHSDHATIVMLGLAETYLVLADSDAADHWRDRTLATARQSQRLHDMGHVLAFGGCLHPAMARRYDEMARSADELNDLVTRHDLRFWRGHADLFSGLSRIRRGETDEGFGVARRGVEQLFEANAFSNCWYVLYAEACLHHGRLDEAADILARVRPSLEQGDVRFAAELHRVDALVASAQGAGVEETRERLQAALDLALSQGARLFVGRIQDDLGALSSPGFEVHAGAPYGTAPS